MRWLLVCIATLWLCQAGTADMTANQGGKAKHKAPAGTPPPGSTEAAPLFVRITPPPAPAPTPAPIVITPPPRGEEAANHGFGNYSEIGLVAVTAALAAYTAFLFGATRRLVKETMIAEGPFLFPEVQEHRGFIPPLPTDRPYFVYNFRNQGKTPAVIRRFRDFTLLAPTLPYKPEFSVPWREREEIYIPIAQGEEEGNTVAHIPEGTTAEEVLDGIRQKGPWLFIVGEVEYEDIFKRVWVQGYCWRIHRITADAFVPWRAGGRAFNARREVKDSPWGPFARLATAWWPIARR